MEETNLKAVWFQGGDVLEKAELTETIKRWLPGPGDRERMNRGAENF